MPASSSGFLSTAVRQNIVIRYLCCFWLVFFGPTIALAQDPDAEEQEYVSLRIDVWSKRLRSIEEDGFGSKLKVALSTAIFRYRTLDDLLDSDTEHINALGVRPKLEFEYPTSVANVFFVPELELALNRSLDTSNRLLSAAAKAAFTHRRNGDPNDVRTTVGIKYATSYELDGLNLEEYVELSLKLELRLLRAFDLGQRTLTIRPFGEIKRFIEDLEFKTESGAIFDVDRQYEIGLEFSTAPRKKIWGIALPKLKLSYVFGPDFKGIKVRL